MAHPGSRLSLWQVRNIYDGLRAGMSCRSIAHLAQTSPATVSIQARRWGFQSGITMEEMLGDIHRTLWGSFGIVDKLRMEGVWTATDGAKAVRDYGGHPVRFSSEDYLGRSSLGAYEAVWALHRVVCHGEDVRYHNWLAQGNRDPLSEALDQAEGAE